MANIFVDTNYFVGLANRTPETEIANLDKHQAYISVLSCHILFYVNKIKTPDKAINAFISDFNLVNFGKKILSKSLLGPTNDLEDNIQLHSAVEADCDIFLTSDKKLLKLGYFGKTRISSEI